MSKTRNFPGTPAKIAAVTSDSQDYTRHRSKGIYLLPNLLTAGCLFSGFYAVVAAIDKHFDHAGMAGFAALIFGTPARRIPPPTRTASLFGKEYARLPALGALRPPPAISPFQPGVVR